MKRIFQVVVVLFCVAWLAKYIIIPVGAGLYFYNDFIKQTAECGQAMDTSWYMRQEKNIDKRTESIQMLACHEYDKTRKILLMAGLPESALSYIDLRALELNQRPAEDYVKQHRFVQR